MRAAGQLDDETVVKIREEAIQQMGDMSDSIISQMALAFVRQEYDAIGVDTDALTTSYLSYRRHDAALFSHHDDRRHRSLLHRLPYSGGDQTGSEGKSI